VDYKLRSAITHRHRLWLLVAVVAVAALAASFGTVQQQVIAGLEYTSALISAHPVRGALLFVAVSALSAMLMFFSSVVLVPVGIGAWGDVGCFLLLWSGWFLGGLLTYSIGRHLGRPIVERLLTRAEIEVYEHRIPPSGSFLKAFLVQLAFPSDVVGYFFGLLRYPRASYLGSLLCAEFPYAFGTVFLGAAFLQKQYVLLATGVVITLVVLAWQWWMRNRKPEG
jgi:uncharacterized membrane protein YdjX (TVP38/TMEM64 family)